MIKQHERILVVLRDAKGQPVSKSDLEAKVGKEVVFSRISTYMWDLRTKNGADIKVNKEGKSVVSYQLTNWQKFENFKLETSAPVVAPVVASEPGPKRKAKTVTKKPVKPVTVDLSKQNNVVNMKDFQIDNGFDDSGMEITPDNVSDLVERM